MHSLEPELSILEAAGELSTAEADRLGALESGRVFTVRRELQVVLYVSVAAVVAGVGILVQRNLDRIGPVTLLAGIVVAALACYATAFRTRAKGRERSLPGDYLLLLAALLASAAVGYAEYQFRIFGPDWSWHLLLLALLHGVTAYRFGSALVLSVALASFAAWLGLSLAPGNLWSPVSTLAGAGERALLCAACFVLARWLHRHLAGRPDFLPVYEHFAATLAFVGALVLLHDAITTWRGFALLAVLAGAIGTWGFRRGRELFVLYAVGYATWGICVLEGRYGGSGPSVAMLYLVTILAAVALLVRLRAGMRDATP